jgi:hypothetical protein
MDSQRDDGVKMLVRGIQEVTSPPLVSAVIDIEKKYCKEIPLPGLAE